MDSRPAGPAIRHLVLVLGDQLDARASALDGFDPVHDRVLMVEARHEASYVPQHRQRLVVFFSAMRHFRESLRARGLRVEYRQLDEDGAAPTLDAALIRTARELAPRRLILMRPGDHRVLVAIQAAARALELPLEVREDRHFLCTPQAFREHAGSRRRLLMETFYRGIRRHHGILVTPSGEPVSGRWNFDAENRGRLAPGATESLPAPAVFPVDDLTRAVRAMVAERFPHAPGDPGHPDHLAYPTTSAEARHALEDFVERRLVNFGRYQDAMAQGHRTLYHSLLSSALNLHLLDPRDVVAAAVRAHEEGRAPLNAVEGFVRQIVGWREYVRGVYWWRMPAYADLNVLEAELPVPSLMWTAHTDMACVRDAVQGLLETGYAHHIQRLMVLGLFAMQLGVHPYRVHEWHLSLYVDAVDWVSLPNVLGMSQFGDGGIVGSKPYCASGNYIKRMSDHCRGCRYDPRKASGDDACPITTLYWDFLARNRERLKGNHRMGFQLKNLDRKTGQEVKLIRRHAERVKAHATAH